MTIQMTVSLPPKRVHQYLQHYFKFKKNIDVKHSESSHILLHAGGYRNKEYASTNIEIKIHSERDETRLTLNFSFRGYYLTALMFGLLALGIIWFIPLIAPIPYPVTGVSVLSIVILAWWSIAVPFGIIKTKRKFLDDIRKAFETD